MVKLSVIVPIYNVEKYLEEALESLKEQTFRDFEVIMINDGSTDNSQKIAEKFLDDNRFKLHNNRLNGGLSHARNNGIDLAKGEYIYFFDSDDYLPNNLFEYLVSELNDADIVSFNSTYLNRRNLENINRIVKKKGFSRKQAVSLLLNHSIETAPWSYIFKQKLLDNHIRFPEGYNFEDITFTPKILEKISKMELIEFAPAGYYYRIRQGSITNSMNTKSRIREVRDKQVLNKEKLNYLLKYHNKKEVYEWYVKELCMLYIQYYDSLSSEYKTNFMQIRNEVKYYSKDVSIMSWQLRDKMAYIKVHSNFWMPFHKYCKKIILFLYKCVLN